MHGPQHAVAGESGSFPVVTVLTSICATLQQSGKTIFRGPSEDASAITQSGEDPFTIAVVAR